MAACKILVCQDEAWLFAVYAFAERMMSSAELVNEVRFGTVESAYSDHGVPFLPPLRKRVYVT